MSCPISHERLVEYWASDVDAGEAAAIEAHLFACARCTAAAERVAALVQAFRTALPPVIGHEELAALRAKGLVIVENEFAPASRTPVVFDRHADLLVHRLSGLDLAGAVRVEVLVRSEAHGPMFQELFAPFDASRGEVLIACQKHFAALPHDVAFDVRVHREAAPPTLTTYSIPHEFQ